MQLQYDTVVMLARLGDDQAVRVLRSVENNTRKSLLQTTFYFQEGPGIFIHVDESRRPTMMGMPALEPTLLHALVGPHANRV